MKTIFSAILIISIAVSSAFAQEDVLRPKGKREGDAGRSKGNSHFLTIGAELGLNYNMFSQDITWYPNYYNTVWDPAKSGSGFSPYVNVFADIPLSENWGLQGKLAVDWKYFENDGGGIITDVTNGINSFDATYKYDVSFVNIDVALLFRYNFNKNFFMLFGPVILFNNGNLENNWKEDYFNGREWENISDAKDSISFNTRVGLEIGVGYKFPIAKHVWLVPQARFQWVPTVLTDYKSTSGVNLFGVRQDYDFDYKNRYVHSIQLGLGVWFDLYK